MYKELFKKLKKNVGTRYPVRIDVSILNGTDKMRKNVEVWMDKTAIHFGEEDLIYLPCDADRFMKECRRVNLKIL